MQQTISSLAELPSLAETFIKHIGPRRIFAFYGQMGAGKTTFIKAICDQLGVTDVVNSPSFAIVNEYAIPPSSVARSISSDLHSIFHFDFYRIKKLDEVYDIGYEDYFYSGQLCFLEWPELIEPLLPDDVVKVSITVNPDKSRTFQLD